MRRIVRVIDVPCAECDAKAGEFCRIKEHDRLTPHGQRFRDADDVQAALNALT